MGVFLFPYCLAQTKNHLNRLSVDIVKKLGVKLLDNYATTKYNLIVVINHIGFYERRISMNTQYKKGVLELCVLSLLKKRDCYGYEIAESLSNRIAIADGSVYPILRKLKSDGLLTTYLQEESGGPPRKYYSLTTSGLETYEMGKTEYLRFAKAVENLLEEDEHDET